MRARHRHFNPRHADAIASYDTRFISGQSNNTQLTSWAERSGGTAFGLLGGVTGPQYKTNQVNGNPMAEFTTDAMTRSMTMNSSSVSVLIFVTPFNGTQNYGRGISAARPGVMDWNDNSTWHFLTNDTPAATIGLSSNLTFSGSSVQSGSNNIVSGSIQTTSSVRINGISFTTSGSRSGNFNVTNVGLGRHISGGGDSGIFNMGSVSFFNSNLLSNTALTKKLEHSLAYSFKIACS